MIIQIANSNFRNYITKLGLNIEIVKQNLNNSGATVKISVK